VEKNIFKIKLPEGAFDKERMLKDKTGEI